MVSAVLFVKNLASVTAFYRDVLAVPCVKSSDDHAILDCGNFELVVHQIPQQYAEGIRIDTPPSRREQAAMKLIFAVDSIVRARKAAAERGGMLDPGPPRWVAEEQKICLGQDPEGNVFQLQEND